MTHPGPDPAEEPVAPDTAQATVVQEAPERAGGRRGLTIGVIVAVVVLIGAGLGTWAAAGHSDQPGSDTPQAATEKLMTDLGKDDLIGVVNDLPPAEVTLVDTTVNGLNGHLKQIGVVKPNVDAQDASGLTVRTFGIRFGSSPVDQVNDHIAITKLVAGTITIGSRLSSDNYTANFLRTAFPQGVSDANGSTTLDIGRQARRLGHPVRIATVNVDDRWYPSLLYTVADSVLQDLHQPWPTQALGTQGADIGNEAVEDFLQAILNGDAEQALERTEPSEMAVLHDMGRAVVDATHVAPADRIRIVHVAFDDRHVPGGINAVITTFDLLVHGRRINVRLADGCYTVEAAGKRTSLCAGGFGDAVRGTPLQDVVPRPVVRLVDDMFGGLARTGVGIVTTEDKELWYVNPGLTANQLARDLYGSITGPDLAQALRLMFESE